MAVFSEKTDAPHLRNQSMVAICHEAVTLKIRSRSPKSNKLRSCPIYIGLEIW